MFSPPVQQWKQVLLRDPCVYCGAQAHGLDHITPQSAGGADHWENRAPACATCDNEKGATPLVVFLVAHQTANAKVARRTRYRTPDARAAAIRGIQRKICEAFYRGNIRVVTPAVLDRF